MNVQAHMSGAGQVPNQAGLPQQNGSALAQQMHNLGGGGGGGLRVLFTAETEMNRARAYMQDKM